MMKQHIPLCTGIALLACLLIHGSAWGQQAPVAAGGDAIGSGGSVSYSVGQVVYHTHGSGTGTVAEGVQQPYEISIITNVPELDLAHDIGVFPNPASEALTVQLDGLPTTDLHYQLFDADGRLADSGRINSDPQTIPFGTHANGTYLLTVIQDQSILRTFRIIKH